MSEPTPSAAATLAAQSELLDNLPRLTYRRDQRQHCKRLVVAVHGMGDQSRNDFVQNIAQLFAANYAQEFDLPHQVTRLPAGAWDSGGDPADDEIMAFCPRDVNSWLMKYAFAEVYWAHIPRRLETEGYRQEESKKWARSVAERAVQRHHAHLASGGAQGGEQSPLLAGAVVEEIADTLRIVERVVGLARKAGMVDLNLAEIIERYLGDVQQVNDFKAQRRLIRLQFLKRMEKVAAECPLAEEIHIIAHSEGTVVAFLGLLYALLADESWKLEGRVDGGSEFAGLKLGWIHKVRSFTTLGSPIDKHLVLWPDIWAKFRNETDKGVPTRDAAFWKPLAKPIRWRNYYDLADPVGFQLDATRDALDEWACGAFDFECGKHDHGFRRYPLPGVAHINYFSDTALFGTIIRDSIQDPIEPGAKPQNETPPNTCRGPLSRWIPFAIVGAVLLAAVFILHKAIAPSAAGNCCGERTGVTDVCHSGLACFQKGMWGLIGCTALLYGTTVLARVLRITKNAAARGKAWLAWLAGAGLFVAFPGCYASGILSTFSKGGSGVPGEPWASVGLVIAMSLGLVGLARWLDDRQLSRRKPPVWGLRLLMLLGGGAVVLTFVLPRLADRNSGGDSLALVSAGIAFIYLWWLAILLFDLAFVWKTYINTTSPGDTFVGKLAEAERAVRRQCAAKTGA